MLRGRASVLCGRIHSLDWKPLAELEAASAFCVSASVEEWEGKIRPSTACPVHL